MTEAENTFVQGVSSEDFLNECVECWASAGFPLVGDMASIIMEEFNNEAIDNILARGYDSGELVAADTVNEDEENERSVQ